MNRLDISDNNNKVAKRVPRNGHQIQRVRSRSSLRRRPFQTFILTDVEPPLLSVRILYKRFQKTSCTRTNQPKQCVTLAALLRTADAIHPFGYMPCGLRVEPMPSIIF